ncbi:MAG: hypothetical protein V3V49_13100 [Candidatus Krumholzibacteria bacterium]
MALAEKQDAGFRYVEISILLVSVAMLMFEILQTMTMSLQALERNAFLVVSLCLLGLGSGGAIATWLSARRNLLPVRVLWWSAVAFSVTLVVTTIASSWTVSLPALIVLGILPYVFVGIYLAYLFKSWPARANRLYFINLVGSGLGCVGLVWIVNGTGDVALTLFLIAVVSLIAAAMLALTLGRRQLVLPVAVIVVLVVLVPFRHKLYGFRPASEKGMALIINDPSIESEITWSRWSYLGRVDVLKPGAGIENFRLGGPPVRKLLDQGCKVQFLFASGGNWTQAIDFGDNVEARDAFVRDSRHSMAYILTEEPEVLNIGFGGGVDIFLALSHGAASVVGVEINPLMIEAGRVRLSGYFEDFYNDPRVTVVEMDGRTYVRNPGRKFDVVSLTEVDTGELLHSNAHVLLESYLYTHEAFEDYMNILNEDGFLYVSRPHLQMWRGITTAISVLRDLGVPNPAEHFAILGRGEIGRSRWRSVLVSKKPLRDTQKQRILDYYPEEVVYLPGYEGSEGMWRGFFATVETGSEDEYMAASKADFSPVWDDRPFFYEFSKSLSSSFAGRILFKILLWVTVIATVLIIVPMLRMRLPGKAAGGRAAGVLGYFAAIGAGFMFIEIGMIQKLVLFLGHPSYSITVTLFSILVFSGLGAMFAKRFEAARARTAVMIWLPIVAAAVFYAAGISAVLTLVRPESMVLRVILAAVLLAPGSFFMGMPFPTMIRLLEGDDEPLIPWAWAINSFTSVAASVLTVLVAMRYGFTFVMYLGALIYIVAFSFFLLRVRSLGARAR